METKVVDNTSYLLNIRNIVIEDYEMMIEVMNRSYPTMNEVWHKKHIASLISKFPEGQICVEDNGVLVAFALSIVVDYKKIGDNHTYAQIIGKQAAFEEHTEDGDVLYGIDVCVDPKFRGLRLGRRLYDARKELCENLNLKSILAGGRMPNYHKHSKELSPKEYIQKVRDKEIYDPVLYFQMSNDFHVKKVLKNYLPDDKDSKQNAVLIEWNNIYYQESTDIGASKSSARIGVVQWKLRAVSNLQSFFDNVEFFVDAVSGYKADFVLFPELFNAPLMAEFNEDNPAMAIRNLAGYTDQIRDKMLQFALEYNINIIAGSMPVYEDDKLYNVSYLLRRNGTYETQAKIHVTPAERADWGMTGGDKIEVFDTDAGKVGILICYDSEFPELSRIMAEQGMQILFVPFATDMQNGYLRVRICSQARAIENECYVVISGSVGNLPKVVNMDIQFGQAAVFSPSDFAFPSNATVAEGTPNTENTIICDVDLNDLKHLHSHGSVRNLKDRRHDLYEVKLKK
jgi:predicted amidohydrolase/ribosomal protein S18 acetylase RimI-like enzyme